MIENYKIGWGVCGSFCTIAQFCRAIEPFAEKNTLIPIVSDIVRTTDTRFGDAVDVVSRIEYIASRDAIKSIRDAEPLGPSDPLDLLIIAPCTGNTLAKIANGITDTPVTMAAKAHLRQDRPLLIALCSNDALSQNLANVATLLTRKSCYFVPMTEDDPKKKPYSLIADIPSLHASIESALSGKQMMPLFV